MLPASNINPEFQMTSGDPLTYIDLLVKPIGINKLCDLDALFFKDSVSD